MSLVDIAILILKLIVAAL
ncbi:hypothetical protein L1G88_001149 [Escherichia coli]|nr:hypothetical protein [Escherichia coli]EIT0657543.1 hypothetical protein [Escherichia coli]HCQ4106479.1 hypothetical protein [Escherichia coli]HCX5646005.1 type I toxin-antitoxin system toxin TisB [Escherichia coli]